MRTDHDCHDQLTDPAVHGAAIDADGREHVGALAEPIAIIGMACRVPGAADTEQFWDNLVNGVESIRRFTVEEQIEIGVNKRAAEDPNFVAAAPVLDDYDALDAALFRMTPREAEIKDPQQRLFLELSHSALEDAGYDPARYPGEIGVYGGIGADEYQWKNIHRNPPAQRAAGSLSIATSNHSDYLATYVSYKLNLRGPSLRCTPHAPRHWSRSTWPANRCATANARWRWPVRRPSRCRTARATSTPRAASCRRTGTAAPSMRIRGNGLGQRRRGRCAQAAGRRDRGRRRDPRGHPRQRDQQRRRRQGRASPRPASTDRPRSSRRPSVSAELLRRR